MPDLSRRTIVALVALVAGLTFIVLALVGGSGASSDSSRQDTNRAVEPVSPLVQGDEDQRPGDVNPLKDRNDPFATSFGSRSKRKVTVRVAANGPGRVGVRYRKGGQQVRTFQGGYTQTRTIRSRSPVVQVGMQIFPPASRGTCTVTIDGVKISTHTTTKRFGVVVCFG